MTTTYVLIAWVAGVGLTQEFHDHSACLHAAKQIRAAADNLATTICTEKGQTAAPEFTGQPSRRIIRVMPAPRTPDPYAPR